MPQQVIPDDALVPLQDRIEHELGAIAGVTGISATSALPLTALTGQNTLTMPGAPGNTGQADRDTPLVDYIGARAGYAEAIGARVITGRSFDRVRRSDLREALIDQHLAAQFFPGRSPVGAKIPFRDNTLTVVGVIQQTRMYDVHRDGRPQVFIRAEDWGYRGLFYVLRTEREPERLVPEVRAAVRRVDSRLALTDVRTMDQIVENSLRQQRLSAVLIASFALGALVLATMGVFGVVAGSVARRRHELALRLALGADHGRVLRQVLAEGAALVGIGMLIGVPGIVLARELLRGILVGVSPSDPLTLGAVAVGLAFVAIVACYLPARRVLRIDPAQSLRFE
jgi:putative ABC transport system permease protein